MLVAGRPLLACTPHAERAWTWPLLLSSPYPFVKKGQFSDSLMLASREARKQNPRIDNSITLCYKIYVGSLVVRRGGV